MELLLNRLWGDKLCFSYEHTLFLESMKEHVKCEKAILCSKISKEKLEKLRNYYDYIIELPRIDSLFDVHNYTHHAIIDFFLDHEFILYTDCLDVIIQSDPIEYLKKFDENLFLFTPGYTGFESLADRGWITAYNKTLIFEEDFYQEKVINGGVYGGKTLDFLNFSSFIISNINRNSWNIADQSSMNHYVKLMEKTNKIKIFNTQDDNWTYFTQTFADNPIIKDKKIYTKNNELYCIWHAWDDLKEGKCNQNKIDIGF